MGRRAAAPGDADQAPALMIAAGVRIPINEREERHAQVLTYLLWDWFDGSFFDFWNETPAPGRVRFWLARVVRRRSPRGTDARGAPPRPSRTPARCSRHPTTAWRATTAWSRRSARTFRSASTWRSSMMANSGRDPYFRPGSAASRPIIPPPPPRSSTNARPAICRCCSGRRMPPTARRPTFLRSSRSARDVRRSCARRRRRVVHCVPPDFAPTGSALRETFNGGFVMQPTPASGTRRFSGPSRSTAGRTTIMRSVSGFEQSASPHIVSRWSARHATRCTRRRAGPTAASSASCRSRCPFTSGTHPGKPGKAQLPVVSHARGERVDSHLLGHGRPARGVCPPPVRWRQLRSCCAS